MSNNFAGEVSLSYSGGIFNMWQTRHGAEGFTSPPKEVVPRILSPLKIRHLRPGLNPRTLDLIVSKLLLLLLSESANCASTLSVSTNTHLGISFSQIIRSYSNVKCRHLEKVKKSEIKLITFTTSNVIRNNLLKCCTRALNHPVWTTIIH
jgi:hypothetical protein